MTENRTYKPVGGVTHVELYAVHGLSQVQELVQGQGLAVTLMDDGSHYDEIISSDGLPVSVQHTLTLCARGDMARPWIESTFLAHATAEGVAARIVMQTGEEIVVGWSTKFGFEQALRLQSLHFNSGSCPQQTPTVVMTLSSHDTTSALGT